MKVVLDAYTFRTTPLLKLPLVADLGYEYVELSPPGGLHPVLPAPACRRR
jgi:hypothetical protein